MANIYDMVDTWTDSGTTYTAIKMDVSDTASAAGSLLIDLKVGGVTQFSVAKDGSMTGGAVTNWNTAYSWGDHASAGYLTATNNLSDLNDAATARSNLGLVIGTDVQAYDATIVVDADIGVTVQGYDADTAKTDVAQTFTASQRGTVTTDNDASLDLSSTNNFSITPTGSATLTFTNIASSTGQSGMIKLVNSSAYTISAAANTKISAADLTAISATGTYVLNYFCDGTNVYLVASVDLT